MSLTMEEILERAKNQTDEDLLARLALKGPHWMIRKEAVKNPNLCDPSVFEKVLLNEKDDYICFYAYGRLQFINPESELFLNPQDVAKITDEEKLIEIIRFSIYKAPTIAGGSRINRRAVYPYLVCPDKRWEVRYEAVANPNLKDEGVLREVALNDYDIRVRCAAITNPNLNDQEFFSHLALNDSSYSVRCDAAEQIRDEEILKQIISNDSKSTVRVYAISNPNLKDQSFLTDLAFNDYDYNVRRAAVLKIDDENVLKDIFANDNHGEVKKTVCRCISDVSFLRRIATGRFKWKLKIEAGSRLRKLNDDYTFYPKDKKKKIDKSSPVYQFQEMNTTCECVYDLGDLEVLIVLKDGTNLTSWDDVAERSEVLFVSEDLSNQDNLEGKYSDLPNLKAIVTTGISDNVTSLENMFFGCFSLSDILSLKDWDVSNVCNMKGLFKECNHLKDISPLSGWDVSNAVEMSAMFENCFSLGSISPLVMWETENVCDMAHMFDDCHSLEDISGLRYWDVKNVENMEYMFSCCNYLKDISYLERWDVSGANNMAHMFDGCDYLDEFLYLCDWPLEDVENTEAMFSNCAVDEETIREQFKELDCGRRNDLKGRYIPLG